jgi:hypothetical protein
MANDKKSVRVVEIRAAENGWVLTAFEREASPWNDSGSHALYFAMVAESAESAAKQALSLMKSETWDRAVNIPPARRTRE